MNGAILNQQNMQILVMISVQEKVLLLKNNAILCNIVTLISQPNGVTKNTQKKCQEKTGVQKNSNGTVTNYMKVVIMLASDMFLAIKQDSIKDQIISNKLKISMKITVTCANNPLSTGMVNQDHGKQRIHLTLLTLLLKKMSKNMTKFSPFGNVLNVIRILEKNLVNAGLTMKSWTTCSQKKVVLEQLCILVLIFNTFKLLVGLILITELKFVWIVMKMLVGIELSSTMMALTCVIVLMLAKDVGLKILA